MGGDDPPFDDMWKLLEYPDDDDGPKKPVRLFNFHYQASMRENVRVAFMEWVGRCDGESMNNTG